MLCCVFITERVLINITNKTSTSSSSTHLILHYIHSPITLAVFYIYIYNTQMKITGFESNVSMHFPNLFHANSIMNIISCVTIIPRLGLCHSCKNLLANIRLQFSPAF